MERIATLTEPYAAARLAQRAQARAFEAVEKVVIGHGQGACAVPFEA